MFLKRKLNLRNLISNETDKSSCSNKKWSYFIAECARTRDFKWKTDEEVWYSYGTGGRRMAVRNKVVVWIPLPKKYDGE